MILVLLACSVIQRKKKRKFLCILAIKNFNLLHKEKKNSYNCNLFCSYIVGFDLGIMVCAVTVSTLTDLGFLWFREFYLESSRVIQVKEHEYY